MGNFIANTGCTLGCTTKDEENTKETEDINSHELRQIKDTLNYIIQHTKLFTKYCEKSEIKNLLVQSYKTQIHSNAKWRKINLKSLDLHDHHTSKILSLLIRK